MKIYFHNQSQFELFPGAVAPSKEKTNPRFYSTHLTLPLEKIIILGIIIIMSMVLSFSFGVERGKRFLRSQTISTLTLPAGDGDEKRIERPTASSKPQNKLEKVTEVNSIQLTHKTSVGQKTPDIESTPKKLSGQFVIHPTQEQVFKENVYDSDLNKIVDKGYTIQVASFKKDTYAQKEAMALKNDGFEIYVIPKGKHLIVCVGKFAKKSEAELLSNKLRKRYKDCLIRSL